MKIKANVKFGDNAVQIEGEADGFKGMIKALSSFVDVPIACECGSKNLWPNFRSPKGFDYYSILCKDCGKEFKYGQKKDGGELYPKGWEAPYQSDKGESFS